MEYIVNRYFRSSIEIYNNICNILDEAYNYPNSNTKTQRTLPLVETLQKDQTNKVYLVVGSEYCDYILPSQILIEYIANGNIEEITEDQYKTIFPVPEKQPRHSA